MDKNFNLYKGELSNLEKAPIEDNIIFALDKKNNNAKLFIGEDNVKYPVMPLNIAPG